MNSTPFAAGNQHLRRPGREGRRDTIGAANGFAVLQIPMPTPTRLASVTAARSGNIFRNAE